jgi:hypothetical protein
MDWGKRYLINRFRDLLTHPREYGEGKKIDQKIYSTNSQRFKNPNKTLTTTQTSITMMKST